ncbi:MAG: PEP-CTERM sorting domain-containing protein [Burkholderiales bacterium]|nr:PEP-CTERM sorting domain-containing protein [Burkholderiales bacterium]
MSMKQCCAGMILGLTAASAAAMQPSLVSVSGGFLGYSGPAGYGDVTPVGGITGALTYINGQVLVPSEPLPGFEAHPGMGTAQTSFFVPASGVEYWIERDDPANPGFSIEDPRNLIRFTPAPAQPVFGTGPTNSFLLGSFELENGVFWAFAGVNLPFRLTTQSNDPAFAGHVLQDTLRWVSTPNAGSPYTAADRADYFYFADHAGLGSMRVYEIADGGDGSGFGTVELWGAIGSLTPTQFANPTGSVFIQAVPEPHTWVSLGLGLGILGWRMRQRVRAVKSRPRLPPILKVCGA